MDFMWTTVLISLVLVYILRKLMRNRRRNQILKKIPGPQPLPILGNMLCFSEGRHKLLTVFKRFREEYGETLVTWHGSRPVVNLYNPQSIEKILSANNKHIRKGKAYDFLLPWLGTGLLTSAGGKWFSHRKLITPTFHFKILEGFIDIFNEAAQLLVASLASKANGQYFDICPEITLCALDIICETAMGTKINAMENSNNPYVTATLRISKLSVDRLFKLWHHPDYIFFNSATGKEYKETLSTIHTFTEKVIRERRQARRGEIKGEGEADCFGAKRRLAFLDLLLDSAENDLQHLTDTEIREEVDTFMFEGHDTTTMAIAWTLFLLGNHKDIQTAVREELNNIFQGEDRSITIRDLGEMKLLERVIKEALRLYPSVPVITRITDEDVKLDDGYTIPKNTDVALHILNMHRNPKVYENPDDFDPDRFLPHKSLGRSPYAYLPFSAGQRNCVGQKFAIFEEKIIIASIIRKFELQSKHKPEEVTKSQELVVRPQIGAFVKMVPANRTSSS